MDERLVAGLSKGPRQYVERLVGRCQPLVPHGETVRVAWTAKKGIGANNLVMLSWFTQPLLIFQSFRVIALTNAHLHVFKSGWFTRYKPKQLLESLPTSAIRPASRGRFQLGSDTLQVDRPFLQHVVAAVMTHETQA